MEIIKAFSMVSVDVWQLRMAKLRVIQLLCLGSLLG